MEKYRAFHFESIGASHLKKGTVCQDSSASLEKEDYRLAVICDGHGGEDYFRSDRGSRMAVQAFCECTQRAFSAEPRELAVMITEAPSQEIWLLWHILCRGFLR